MINWIHKAAVAASAAYLGEVDFFFFGVVWGEGVVCEKCMICLAPRPTRVMDTSKPPCTCDAHMLHTTFAEYLDIAQRTP